MDNSDISAYIGFCIPEDLKAKVDRLIKNLRDKVTAHQGALYGEVVLGLVDESMDTFFLRPIGEVGISSVGSRVVVTGVKSVKKAVSMLVNTLSKKLTNEEMKPLAEYLYEVIYVSKTSPDDLGQAYMASPINTTLDNELLSIIKDIESGETGTAIEERLVAAMLEVSEVSLTLFFAKPLAMIKLGMIMRKTSQVAYDGTRAAIRGVIKKVFKGMSEPQLRGVAQYIRSVRFPKTMFIAAEAA